MIITIQTIDREFTKTGKEYLKVTGITGDGKQTTKSIFDNLKEKWELLVENATLEFVMQKVGQFWNVTDIKKPELTGEKAQEPTKVTPATTKPVPVRSYGKSDEEIQSIERQVGFKGAIEIMVAYIRAGRFKDDKPKQIATNTLLIAKEFETHLTDTAKIVEKIEEAIKEG